MYLAPPSELEKKNLKEMDKFSKNICHTQLFVYKYFSRNLGKLSLISSYDNEKDMRLTKLNKKKYICEFSCLYQGIYL